MTKVAIDVVIRSAKIDHVSTLILEILKIKDLKTTNRDHKKPTKQGSRYCSIVSVECVIHMAYCLVGI